MTHAPVVVAEAPAGVPATRIPARTRDDLRTVAVVAPPSRRSRTDLPLDLLAELGKRDDVAGRSSHTQDASPLVSLWLRAHRTEWVVVTSPHVLTVPHLQLLPALVLPAGARLLLACDPSTGTQVADGLADYGAARIDWHEAARLVPPPAGSSPPEAPPQTAVWTDRDLTLPREDWPLFRSECRRLLHADTFAAVDAEYVRAFRAARAWLKTNEPYEQGTADLVGSIVGEAGSLDQAIVALRACQAAHMEAGWSLRVDLEQAVNAISQRPVHIGDDGWTALRAYREPHRSAVITLHQHGLTVAAMHRLTTGQANDDGSLVAGTAIDPRGRAYLRAQILDRRSGGAGPDDPLFEEGSRRSVNAIRDAREDLSLRLGTGRVSGIEHLADRWQRRLGLQLWDLR